MNLIWTYCCDIPLIIWPVIVTFQCFQWICELMHILMTWSLQITLLPFEYLHWLYDSSNSWKVLLHFMHWSSPQWVGDIEKALFASISENCRHFCQNGYQAFRAIKHLEVASWLVNDSMELVLDGICLVVENP